MGTQGTARIMSDTGSAEQNMVDRATGSPHLSWCMGLFSPA